MSSYQQIDKGLALSKEQFNKQFLRYKTIYICPVQKAGSSSLKRIPGVTHVGPEEAYAAYYKDNSTFVILARNPI